MSQQKETERVREIFDASAADYDKGMAFNEKLFLVMAGPGPVPRREGRCWRLPLAPGSTCPSIQPMSRLRGSKSVLPCWRSPASAHKAWVVRSSWSSGTRRRYPFPDQRFDTVVCTISLCSIPDERQAVAEVWRVLRPGGRFVALEHVRSPNIIIRGLERLLESLRGAYSGRSPFT